MFVWLLRGDSDRYVESTNKLCLYFHIHCSTTMVISKCGTQRDIVTLNRVPPLVMEKSLRKS